MITKIEIKCIDAIKYNIDRSMHLNDYVNDDIISKVKTAYKYVKYTSYTKSIIEKWAPILEQFGREQSLENVTVIRTVEQQLQKMYKPAIFYSL